MILMVKKNFNRRDFIKLGLGFISTSCMLVSAKEKESTKMEVDLNVKTKVTSMSIHEKGRENEKPKTNSGFYLGLINAEVDFKNCTVEIVINDIPVYRFIEGQESYQTESVADFLIAGTNKLEVVINPGATPATARDKFLGEVKKDISVSTRLVQYQDGDYFDVDSYSIDYGEIQEFGGI